MGIFSDLFGTSSDIERRLEDQYLPALQSMIGLPLSQAKSAFRDMLKRAKEKSLRGGTSNFPANFGDLMLEKESTDERIKAMLAQKRSEGVRDRDVRWWWNRHDLERYMMLEIDDLHKFALFIKLVEEDGLDDKEAARKVRKHHPYFGDPNDPTHSITTKEDKLLPIELKDRINAYVMRRSNNDPDQFRREIEESSSFNALIRREIREGNI